MMRLFVVMCVAAVLCTASLMAQTGAATVSGQVKDASGAMVPGATIEVQNTDTNVVGSTQTNPEGFFTIPNLIPGNYVLRAQSVGMKNMERRGIVLRVGDRVTLDITMEVGSQAEHVTVTGEAPLLRVEDA